MKLFPYFLISIIFLGFFAHFIPMKVNAEPLGISYPTLHYYIDNIQETVFQA